MLICEEPPLCKPHLARPAPHTHFWQLLAYRRGEHTPEPDLAAIDPAFREVILHMTQLDPGTPTGISTSEFRCIRGSKPVRSMQLIYSRSGAFKHSTM